MKKDDLMVNFEAIRQSLRDTIQGIAMSGIMLIGLLVIAMLLYYANNFLRAIIIGLFVLKFYYSYKMHKYNIVKEIELLDMLKRKQDEDWFK